ncbi:drug/metabolite transporter (DMT)-like permease [Cellulosimicrobium cellulans]|nr:drug/metabolite transporter (DMT)-like permease [Cellulosimicrobium cellulans]
MTAPETPTTAPVDAAGSAAPAAGLAPGPPPARRSARRAALPVVLAVAVTVLLWASAFIGVRAAGHDYEPGSLALGRQLAGSVGLTAIVAVRWLRSGARPVLPRGRVLVAVLAWGVGWFSLYNLALNAAEQHLDAGTTALLVNVAPVLVAVLAGLLLGEGFPRRLLVGMAAAFAGVAIIAAATSSGERDVVGVALGLAAAVLYAGAATSQKRLLSRVDAPTMTWVGCLAGTVALLPFAPALAADAASAPASSMGRGAPRARPDRGRLHDVGLRARAPQRGPGRRDDVPRPADRRGALLARARRGSGRRHARGRCAVPRGGRDRDAPAATGRPRSTRAQPIRSRSASHTSWTSGSPARKRASSSTTIAPCASRPCTVAAAWCGVRSTFRRRRSGWSSGSGSAS